jgi:hypothetical protein
VNPQDILLTTAEIAVAFAGFASLVGALLQRRDLNIRQHVVHPLRVMLDYSLITLFSCLVPLLPIIGGASDANIWRLSSAAWVVGILIYGFLNRALLRELRRASPYPRFVGNIVAGLDFTSLVVMLLNALGVFWVPSFLPYYAIQLWFLGGAALGFVLVVSSVWREPDA